MEKTGILPQHGKDDEQNNDDKQNKPDNQDKQAKEKEDKKEEMSIDACMPDLENQAKESDQAQEEIESWSDGAARQKRRRSLFGNSVVDGASDR